MRNKDELYFKIEDVVTSNSSIHSLRNASSNIHAFGFNDVDSLEVELSYMSEVSLDVSRKQSISNTVSSKS